MARYPATRKYPRQTVRLFIVAALQLLATACASAVSVDSSRVATARATVRIMPLGDSITEADKHHSSYRRPLWQQLRAGNFDVDFVGSKNQNFDGPNPTPDFDLDHEGHWGWRADEILAHLEGSVTVHNPDVALIHLGSNDIFQGNSIASTTDRLEQIIDSLRSNNPQIVILLSQVIPSTNRPSELIALNQAIAALAVRKHNAESPVILVDQWTGFHLDTDTDDGIHPNASGELKMARRWYEALKQLLQSREWPAVESGNGPGDEVGQPFQMELNQQES